MKDDMDLDALNEKPIKYLTREERKYAVGYFTMNAELMIEELTAYTNAGFDIKSANVSDTELREFRDFNKALSDLLGRAYEIAEIAKKQNKNS